MSATIDGSRLRPCPLWSLTVKTMIVKRSNSRLVSLSHIWKSGALWRQESNPSLWCWTKDNTSPSAVRPPMAQNSLSTWPMQNKCKLTCLSSTNTNNWFVWKRIATPTVKLTKYTWSACSICALMRRGETMKIGWISCWIRHRRCTRTTRTRMINRLNDRRRFTQFRRRSMKCRKSRLILEWWVRKTRQWRI